MLTKRPVYMLPLSGRVDVNIIADPIFSKLASVDKKTCIHARIIWSCCWSHDDRYFATASRDKKVLWFNTFLAIHNT